MFLFCINKNEVKDKYITFHYGLWQTDLELMHKHFLTELTVSAGKKYDKQIELSIDYSRLLQKEIILPFFFIILALIFQVFNMASPFFSYIRFSWRANKRNN